MTIEELVEQLKIYSDAYYQGNEIVDDATFDALEDELKQRDPNNDYFKHLRERAYGNKVPHIYEFIGSIDKIHSIEESRVLRNSNVVCISAKLDGTSLVAYFKNGKLDKAVTRGDGKFGMDVTQHYLAITRKYNIHIPENFTGAIRGEVVFTNANWNEFKEKHPDAKAPRNSGTGLINQKTVQPDEELLSYVTYDIVATNIEINAHLEFLQSCGFEVVPYYLSTQPQHIDETALQQLFNSYKLIYPIDGLVIRKIETQLETFLDGLYHFHKDQEAFKFQAEIKLCEVTGIEWQLGRSGKLTPVLQILPTEMSGAIVTRITAHNAETVKLNKLGKGAKILACRSNEVIPLFKQTIEPSDSVIIPTRCPYCGSKLETSPSGKDLFCTFEECEGMLKFKFFNFIEQMCSNVKGIGEVFEEDFFTDLSNFANINIYSLTDFIKYIKKARNENYAFPLLGNSDTKVAKQILEIISSKEYDIEKFFKGLSIRLLGTEAAKKLSKEPTLTLQLIESIKYRNDDEISRIFSTIFPGQTVLLLSFLSEVPSLSKLLLTELNDVKFTFTDLTNIHFYAITGSLSKPRKAIQDEFQRCGWEMVENISRAEVLINNSPDSTSSKNKKARELNKEILSEEEFRNKYLRSK